MQQSINLYDHLQKREAMPASAAHIGIAAAATLVLVIFVSTIMAFSASQQADRIAKAKERQQQLSLQLAELEASARSRTAQFETLDQLKQQLKNKRLVLSSLASEEQRIGNGFSRYLEGLGRQSLNGLWLDHIDFRQGGEQIALRGVMRKASLLPRYLQHLGNEPVFSGLRFQLMRIEDVEETNNEMTFEVTVVPDVEEPAEEV